MKDIKRLLKLEKKRSDQLTEVLSNQPSSETLGNIVVVYTTNIVIIFIEYT